MRPKGSAEDLEKRRKDAIRVWLSGKFTEKEIAQRFGVHKRTVEKWVHKLREGGMHGLKAIPNVYPTCALDQTQLRRLEKLLLKGSYSLGYDDGLWTCARVAELIEKEFGVSYHPMSIGRLLHERLGWTVQRPQRQAKERDDAEIHRWLESEWREVKKKPSLRGRPLSSWTKAR